LPPTKVTSVVWFVAEVRQSEGFQVILRQSLDVDLLLLTFSNGAVVVWLAMAGSQTTSMDSVIWRVHGSYILLKEGIEEYFDLSWI
jgi:hypothetical protein